MKTLETLSYIFLFEQHNIHFLFTDLYPAYFSDARAYVVFYSVDVIFSSSVERVVVESRDSHTSAWFQLPLPRRLTGQSP